MVCLSRSYYISLQIFWGLSSINFTWSILEYLDSINGHFFQILGCCEKCASLQNKNLSIALSTFIVKWVKLMLLLYLETFLINRFRESFIILFSMLTFNLNVHTNRSDRQTDISIYMSVYIYIYIYIYNYIYLLPVLASRNSILNWVL